MWSNFIFLHMTDVEISSISPHVACVWCKNVNTYAKFMLFCHKISFLQFTHLCREICLVVIYTLLCGEFFLENCISGEKWQIWGLSSRVARIGLMRTNLLFLANFPWLKSALFNWHLGQVTIFMTLINRQLFHLGALFGGDRGADSCGDGDTHPENKNKKNKK